MTDPQSTVPPEDWRSGLPYRPNVGICLLDRRGLVFVGRVFPNPDGWPDPERTAPDADWCLPQGGIDPDEDLEAAARRELWEETGVETARFVAATPEWWRYDFPARGGPSHKLHRYRGQEQRFAVFRFEGEEKEIRVDARHTHEPAEFLEWRWRPLPDLLTCGIAHRRPNYRRLIEAWPDLVRL